MEHIAAIQQPASLFKTRYSAAIRIWHWLTFILISASIITVVLAKTLFAMRPNIAMVEQQVLQKGGTITADQARAVAHEYTDKVWEVHEIAGYVICFLLLWRIAIEITYSKEQKLSNKIKRGLQFKTANAQQRYDRKHYLLAKYGYMVFYVLILVMAVTGLVMALEEFAFFKSIRRPFKEVHELTQYLVYLYILAHIVGVIRADLTGNKGIVSGMINGGDK